MAVIRQVSLGGCVALVLLCACDGGTQAATGDAAAMTSGSSGLKGEAEAVVVAALAAHWSQGSDGWSMVRDIGTRYVPQRVIRQMRTLQVGSVKEETLSESNRLNGLDWLGEVNFKNAPCREIGPDGPAFEEQIDMDAGRWRDAGRWTPWTDCYISAVRVQRKGGKWMFDQDHYLMSGMPATSADFAAAGAQ